MRQSSTSSGLRLAVALAAMAVAAPARAQIITSPAGETPLTWGGIVIWEDGAEGQRSGGPMYSLDPAVRMSQSEFDAYMQSKTDAAAAGSARWQAEQDRIRQHTDFRNVNAQNEGLFSLVSEPSAGDGDTGASGRGSGSTAPGTDGRTVAFGAVTGGMINRGGTLPAGLILAIQEMIDREQRNGGVGNSRNPDPHFTQEQLDRLRSELERKENGVPDVPSSRFVATPDSDASLTVGDSRLTLDDLRLLVSQMELSMAAPPADSVISSNGFRSAQIVPIYAGYRLDQYGITWRSLNLFANGPSSVGSSLNTTIFGMPSAVGHSLDLHPAGPSSVGVSLNLYPEGPSSVGQSLDLYPTLCGR